MHQFRNLLIISLGIFIFSCNETQDSIPEDELVAAHDLQYLKEAVEKYPDSSILGQQLIEAYRNNGQYDSAIKTTENLILRDSGNAYLWNVMATLYYETADTIGTLSALEKAIAIYPLPDYYVALGSVYAEMKDPTALDIADALIDQTDPNVYKDDGYFIKGLYYNYSGQYEPAIQALDSALANNYTLMYAYREKAIALMEIGEFTEALKVLKRAVTLQNGYDEGYFWMGKIYEKLDLQDSAKLSYQNALLYDKNYTEAKDALERLKK